jgi:hypothetical protein
MKKLFLPLFTLCFIGMSAVSCTKRTCYVCRDKQTMLPLTDSLCTDNPVYNNNNYFDNWSAACKNVLGGEVVEH